MAKTDSLFVGSKELQFFDCIGKELIQQVIGQHITYYPVSEEHTKTDRLYNESIRKTVVQAIDINALVLYNDPVQQNTNFTIDTIYTIEVYFDKSELEERNVVPRVGDFLKFGEVIYEIDSLVEPQIVFGQIENKVMRKATCRVARKSAFQIQGDINESA